MCCKKGGRPREKLTEAKLKHFCDKFSEAVFEFVATEEKKIEDEEIDKMTTPSDEVSKPTVQCDLT